MVFVAIISAVVLVLFIWYDQQRHPKSHEEVQRELAANMAGMYVKDMMTADEERELSREVITQAECVGDTLTVSAIQSGTYNGPWPERRDDGGWLSIYDNLRILKIAGINHREGINRYVGRVNCALVPEPDNEYDADAIKVVADDRHHLGYIPSGQTEMVCWLTANEFPYRCTAFIESHEDDGDGHQFFTGHVYIKRLD